MPRALTHLLLGLITLCLTACPPKRALYWNPSGTLLAIDTPESGLLTHADGSIIRETPLIGPWVDDRRLLVVQKTAAKNWPEYAAFLSDEQQRVARALVATFEQARLKNPDFVAYLQSAISTAKAITEPPIPVEAGLSLVLTQSTSAEYQSGEAAFLASVALSQILESLAGQERTILTEQLRKAGLLNADPLLSDGFPALPIFEIRVADSEPGSDLPPRILHRGILPPENLTVSPDSKTATFTTTHLEGPKTVFLSVNAQSPGPEGTTEDGPVLAWLSGGRSILHHRSAGLEFKLGQQLEGLGGLILHLDHTGANKSHLARYHLPAEEAVAPVARWGANGLLFASAAQTLPTLSIDKTLSLFVLENLPSRPEETTRVKLSPLNVPKAVLDGIHFSGNLVPNPSGTAVLLVGNDGELALLEQATLRTRAIVTDHGLRILPAWRSDTEFTYAVAPGHPKGSPLRAEVLLETLDADHRTLSSKWPDKILERLTK
jgi:hypothetical protein